MTGLAGYLAESGVALAVFYGLYRVAFRNDTHFQAGRIYLLASLLAAHVLPFAHITSPFRQVVAAPATMDDLVAAAPAAAWEWSSALLGVYLAGAILVVLRLAWHLRHLLLMMRTQPAVRHAGIRVVYVDDDCPPFSFFHTAFVHRPAAGEERLLDQVVAHERTHIRQRHSLDILLIQVAAVGQWFNPFIWFYKTALRELHEYLADREVLAQGFDASIYKHVLFEQHLGARSFEFAHHLRASQIRRRLVMMTRRSGRWALCKYLLAVPALAILLVAFAQPRMSASGGASAIDQQAGKSSSGDTKALEVKKKDEAKATEVAIKEKLDALKKEYDATTDPAKKKAIEEKMLQIKQKAHAAPMTVDMSNPASVQDAITMISKKIKDVKAKSVQVTDQAEKEKLQQSLDTLLKKADVLKARLAELQASK